MLPARARRPESPGECRNAVAVVQRTDIAREFIAPAGNELGGDNLFIRDSDSLGNEGKLLVGIFAL